MLDRMLEYLPDGLSYVICQMPDARRFAVWNARKSYQGRWSPLMNISFQMRGSTNTALNEYPQKTYWLSKGCPISWWLNSWISGIPCFNVIFIPIGPPENSGPRNNSKKIGDLLVQRGWCSTPKGEPAANPLRCLGHSTTLLELMGFSDVIGFDWCFNRFYGILPWVLLVENHKSQVCKLLRDEHWIF